LSNLKPGNYEFQVRVRAGSRASSPAVISFTIQPAWYQQPVIQIICYITLLAGAVFLILFFVKRAAMKVQKAKRESQKLAELELRALRSRMNPHFVFNVLTSIQNFITQGREQEANYYTSQFAHLIRQTFHGSATNFVSLAEELVLLQNYLDLERMRFENRLEYSIEVDELLQPEEVYIPAMLLQPFLENAINHGIRNLRNRKGMLFVRLKKQDSRLLIEIEDNGVGIKSTQLGKTTLVKGKNHKSEGMKLVRDRMDLMNKSYHLDMQLSVLDLSELGAHGTRVLLDLPLQNLGEYGIN
jgi:LytS/YehU family sensor histidine kinase